MKWHPFVDPTKTLPPPGIAQRFAMRAAAIVLLLGLLATFVAGHWL